jgi:hypothetical protein
MKSKIIPCGTFTGRPTVLTRKFSLFTRKAAALSDLWADFIFVIKPAWNLVCLFSFTGKVEQYDRQNRDETN